MILAVSRFRVANGMESEVRDAFLRRPRLVDDVPGFLGMEVFDDTADEAVFYLMTRWTDVGPFRQWHRSDAHRLSHKGIPKGLKLDPQFTKVLELERLATPLAPAALEQLAADRAPFLARFLEKTESVHLLQLSREGTIQACNELVAGRLKRTKAEIVGASAWTFLTERDAARLKDAVANDDRTPSDSFLLNFVDADASPYTLNCRLDVQPDDVVLIGEPPPDRAGYQAEMHALNNELAVLSRENARRGRELARALDQLKEAQSMLVHREKLASLGVMTAGIAHEINNPLAYVVSNHATLKRDLADLVGVLDVVNSSMDELRTTSPAIHQRIATKAADAELSYLLTSIGKKLADNEEGLQRVQQIVLDLRTFSRLDEVGMKSCSVAENVAATVRFLEPLLVEHGVAVESKLDELPPLVCAPGPFNQALSNLVANAVQASKRGQVVRIVAHEGETDCVIEVHDNGGGIAPDHLDKVFDPFFTTKPVGSGTGLGLSIVRQVVAAHHGSVEIESVIGVGTTVRLRLPWHPMPAGA